MLSRAAPQLVRQVLGLQQQACAAGFSTSSSSLQQQGGNPPVIPELKSSDIDISRLNSVSIVGSEYRGASCKGAGDKDVKLFEISC